MRTPDPPLSHPYKHGGRGVGLYDPTLRPKPVMLVSRNLTSRGTKTIIIEKENKTCIITIITKITTKKENNTQAPTACSLAVLGLVTRSHYARATPPPTTPPLSTRLTWFNYVKPHLTCLCQVVVLLARYRHAVQRYCWVQWVGPSQAPPLSPTW